MSLQSEEINLSKSSNQEQLPSESNTNKNQISQGQSYEVSKM